MHRIWFGIAAVVLLLAGCRVGSPAKVPFPDDPRVLHGEWQLQSLARMSPATLVLDSTGDNVAIKSLRESWSFTRVDDAWVDGTARPPAGEYDTTLDAFVTLQQTDTGVLVEMRDFAGDHDQLSLDMPPGTSPSEYFVAAGRLFGLIPDGEASTTLDWWNLLQPADQGRTVVSAAASTLWVSGSGRALAFDDPEAGLIHVVDTRNPARTISLESPCGLYGRVDLSTDGRWLVSGACGLTLRLHDLHDPGYASRELPMSGMNTAGARFAADTAELVWVDPDHAIRSLDVATGQESILYVLSAQDLQGSFYDWTSNVHLHRGASLLAFEVAGGLLKLVDSATGAVTAELLTLRLPPDRLQLQATIEGGAAMSGRYIVTGTFHQGTDTLQVSGTVVGGADHVYVPSGLQPQWSSPRPLDVHLEVKESGADDAVFDMWLTLDAEPGAYRGLLSAHLGGEEPGYQVRLQRPADGAGSAVSVR